MNKTTIRKALVRSCGAEFINKEQIKKCMGWGNDRVNTTVEGLVCITQGKRKQYDVDEVAERILAQTAH